MKTKDILKVVNASGAKFGTLKEAKARGGVIEQIIIEACEEADDACDASNNLEFFVGELKDAIESLGEL
jgi:hypothetical protein